MGRTNQDMPEEWNYESDDEEIIRILGGTAGEARQPSFSSVDASADRHEHDFEAMLCESSDACEGFWNLDADVNIFEL